MKVCLKEFNDKYGNSISYKHNNTEAEIFFKDNVAFNNKLIVDDDAVIKKLKIDFLCSNSIVKIGKCSDGKFNIQLGEDCTVEIGDFTTSTGITTIFTAEGTNVFIGEDCMFAPGVKIKTHDHHPIFDIHSGNRINTSKSIYIGNHVWISENTYIAKGSIIKEGSVIGYGSFVNGHIPNNCIAGGIPAKIIKKDIAWERPLLNHESPFYKLNIKKIKKSDYWNSTLINPKL